MLTQSAQDQLFIQTFHYLKDNINLGRIIRKVTENQDGTITISFDRR
jgi:hypothetical protein